MKRILTVVLVAAAAAAPATGRLAAGRGTITTVAGTGAGGLAGEGDPATQAAVDHPRGLAVLRDGSILVAEPYANVVRRIAPGGTISTVAGDGRAGFGGDGGPAAAAELDFVHGVAAMPDGGFVLADTLNERIRRVFPDGTITTVAGIGINGYNGDGRPATTAALADPRGVATFPDGRILIPDTGNNRIRLVALDGTIQTVAGVGTSGFSGDGGPAIDAELSSPFGVAPLPDGGFLIDDSGNGRIRRVSPDGHITTVDGMRFRVPVRSIHTAPNPRYFARGRGVTWLNYLSDQFADSSSPYTSGKPPASSTAPVRGGSSSSASGSNGTSSAPAARSSSRFSS